MVVGSPRLRSARGSPIGAAFDRDTSPGVGGQTPGTVGYSPMAGPAGSQSPALPMANMTWGVEPGPYMSILPWPPMLAGAPTVAQFDLGIAGHPGAPHPFHWGLGARSGIVGAVGNSQGNPRALIVPPDRYRGLTYVMPYNVRTGRRVSAGEPSRAKAGAVSRGQ